MAAPGRGNQIRLLLLLVLVVLAVVKYPAMRWFVGISVLVGLVMFPLIRWWNSRPVRTPEDEQIRLHLNDEGQDALEPKDGTPR